MAAARGLAMFLLTRFNGSGFRWRPSSVRERGHNRSIADKAVKAFSFREARRASLHLRLQAIPAGPSWRRGGDVFQPSRLLTHTHGASPSSPPNPTPPRAAIMGRALIIGLKIFLEIFLISAQEYSLLTSAPPIPAPPAPTASASPRHRLGSGLDRRLP